MTKTITYLKDRGASISHSDRIYYHKYPYRVDLGGNPYHYSTVRELIEPKFKTESVGDFREGQYGTFYLTDIADVEALIDMGLETKCNVHVSGPLSESHAQVLKDHQRETQVIRKNKWYGKYDIRIKTRWWHYSTNNPFFAPKDSKALDSMVDFIEEQLDRDEVFISEIISYSRSIPNVIYIDSANCEDIVGMIKMQYYDPTDRLGPIEEFARAVIVEE